MDGVEGGGRGVCDGEMGWKCFEVEVLCTEVGRQLVWTLRVAGEAGQGNALEAATNLHLFSRRLQLKI